MTCCHLCEHYITDVLDSPPAELKEDRTEIQRRIRDLIPMIRGTLRLVIHEFKDATSYMGTVETAEAFAISMRYPIFIECIEDVLEEMSRRRSLRVKKFRNWLVNKFLFVLQTIHGVHFEHTTLPKQHKAKKAAVVPAPLVPAPLVPAPTAPLAYIPTPTLQPISPCGLSIKVPKFEESDLYY